MRARAIYFDFPVLWSIINTTEWYPLSPASRPFLSFSLLPYCKRWAKAWDQSSYHLPRTILQSLREGSVVDSSTPRLVILVSQKLVVWLRQSEAQVLVQTTTKLRSCRTVCTARQYLVCILWQTILFLLASINYPTLQVRLFLICLQLFYQCYAPLPLALMGYSGTRKHQLLQYTIINPLPRSEISGEFLQDSMQSTLLSFSTNVRTQCKDSM